MNALNRLIMIFIALLLIAVPTLLVLVNFSVVPVEIVDTYTGYRAFVEALGGVSLSEPTPALRLALGVLCAVICLVALILVLRELVIGKPLERNYLIDDSPNREVKIKTQAVRALIEGAARHAGALQANAKLSTSKGEYVVDCRATLPQEVNISGRAKTILARIQKALEEQSIGYRSVEVTVDEVPTTEERRAETRGTSAEGEETSVDERQSADAQSVA